ncbi:MAG: class A beta-lactamase-related serine hydrolase [Clostridia bacterium]|nr:class A beta-lactamase-related serine hydrolase [Clostridia bacterium]
MFRFPKILSLCAILLAAAMLPGCGTAAVQTPWMYDPIGAQFVYGARSRQLNTMLPIVEETAGGSFVDNRNDVFEDGVITVNNSSYVIPQSMIDTLWSTMEEYKFVTGFYVIDLETHMSFGLNVDKKFSAASTVKSGYALYLAKQLAAGNVALTDILEYKEQHYCTGSGSTQYSEYGTLFTLKALFYRMLYNSDNVAYYMLADYTGVTGVNEMFESLGIDAHLTRLDHWCDFSPRDLATIWTEIWNFKDTCDEGRLLWTYLTTNLYNEFDVAIPQYEKYESAHKSGWNHYGYHESGIVDNGNRQYICVVMTETGNKNDCLHRTIRNLDNIMKDYDIWLKNQRSVGQN